MTSATTTATAMPTRARVSNRVDPAAPLRKAARRRWTSLDWMECRTPRGFAGRGAA